MRILWDNLHARQPISELMTSNKTGNWREFDTDSSGDRDGKISHGKSAALNIGSGLLNIAMAPLSLVAMPVTVIALGSFGLMAPVIFLLKGIKDITIDAPMHGAAMLFKKDDE